MDPGPRGSIRELVLLQAQSNEELAEYARNTLAYKAPLLDRTNAQEIKGFNELVDKSFAAAFPESKRKAQLPQQEFEAKVAKFTEISERFPAAQKIKNYKKKE